jgi:glucokinase
MSECGHILGLDIGGTKTAVVLGDHAGRVWGRMQFPTEPARGFDATFHELCQQTEALLEEARTQGRRPGCLSISIGGPMDVERGLILSPPNLPGWDDIPLKTLLYERFGLPVHIEHDGNAGALAEWYFGAARGARNVIFLTMGSGFGGGLILDGRLYRGTSCLAGEVGHVRLAETGPIAFGKAGSWEAFCSGTGIARLAARRFPLRWREGQISTRGLADLATRGDRDALAVFAETAHHLGRGLAVLIDILNPEVIVIGSLAVRLESLLLPPAREELAKEALPGAVSVCRVVPAELGERLGDVAALCAAIAARRESTKPSADAAR